MKDHIDSPVGRIYLQADDEGLRHCDFRKPEGNFVNEQFTEMAAEYLTAYFEGERDELERLAPPLNIWWATELEKKIYSELQKVGMGKTVTYGTLAKKVGDKKLARAVGNAMAKNRIVIFIPCHRVLPGHASKKKPVGEFGGGSKIKEFLLKWEKVLLPGAVRR